MLSALPDTFALNDARWPVASVAEGGVTFTVTPLVIVTVADAVSGPLPGCGLTVA
jgi:hypothetical protein